MASEALTSQILAALQSSHAGITAKEMAAKLNWKNTKASSLMGRMFFAGVLERRCTGSPTRVANEYIYTIRIAAPARPPLMLFRALPWRATRPAGGYGGSVSDDDR